MPEESPWYGLGVIVNTSTERLHACWFHQRPWPGGDTSCGIRWQSRGHHTAGASNEDELQKHMAELAEVIRDRFKTKDFADLGRIGWTGEGVPAMLPITSTTPAIYEFAAAAVG